VPISLELRLRISLEARCRAFADQVDRQITRVGSTGQGVSHALQMFAHYARAVSDEISTSWEEAAEGEFRIAEMRALGEHLRSRIDIFDSQFRRGHSAIPQELAALVEYEVEAMTIDGGEAVLTVGQPGNFSTFTADLKDYLFRDLISTGGMPPELAAKRLVLIAAPDLEGPQVGWHPVVAGHELAHYLQIVRPVISEVALSAVLDEGKLAKTTSDYPSPRPSGLPRRRALKQIANRWLNELICDAYAVHRFGAAGAAALAEFLEFMGAANLVTDSHPPAGLRTFLMFNWLGEDLTSIESEIVEPLRVPKPEEYPEDWANYISDVLISLSEKIMASVREWCGTASYQALDRSEIIGYLADKLDEGIPGAERFVKDSTTIPVEPADVVNAFWLASNRESTKPIDRLSLKALDTLDFIRRWTKAGGPVELQPLSQESKGAGVLAESALQKRLNASDESRLVLTPLLPGAVKGTGLDLRLGNKFVIFDRSTSASFDALDAGQDPRSMQTTVEMSWGDTFYLHPGQLVLAATLEYLYLPGDLSAQVITRSSYGRLGLISATAVQVHPYFAGCLTLELVNLGELPMAVTPGERIAQLMFFDVNGEAAPPTAGSDKYRFPTGPEFSKVRSDTETTTLRLMREAYSRRRSAVSMTN